MTLIIIFDQFLRIIIIDRYESNNLPEHTCVVSALFSSSSKCLEIRIGKALRKGTQQGLITNQILCRNQVSGSDQAQIG